MSTGERAARRVIESEPAALWLALAILAAVFLLAYRSVDATSETLERVEQSHRARERVADVSAAYARASAARRAYLVLGDDSQLAETADLDARRRDAIEAARAGFLDDPPQLRRIDMLASLIDRRIAALDASVARRTRDGTGGDTALDLALTTEIRATREVIEGEESRTLEERVAHTKRDILTTKLAGAVGILVGFAILVVGVRRLRREIARRRDSERLLRGSESFLDSIVESVPDMLFVKNAGELRFERINRAGELLLGVDRADLIGKNDLDLFPRVQAEAFQARDRETLAGKVIVDIPEEPIQTKQGERWLHTKTVPIFDDQGAPRYLVGISDDITEQRQVSAKLKAARDAAEAANKELEAFSYSVAHDLRAPLRAIGGFSQALAEDTQGKLDEASLLLLGRIRGAAQQMDELIEALIGLARVTRGDFTRERVDFTRLARQIGEHLSAADPLRSVELVIPDGLVVEGDPRLLRAALENLLGNAWKFTKRCKAARVEIGKREEEGRSVFFVKDNGAGFDPAHTHKLFGVFQRLHAKSEFDGSGIGLANVQRIVQRHGGRVWAEGEIGRGASFYFTLS